MYVVFNRKIVSIQQLVAVYMISRLDLSLLSSVKLGASVRPAPQGPMPACIVNDRRKD